MPKRRTQRVAKQDLENALEEAIRQKETEFLAPTEEIHRVKIASCIDAKIKVTGKYSGREYLFERAGSVVDVDQIDVDFLLEKRQGERQCCGGTDKGNRVFALA